jgi:hypothetical protein
VVGVSRCVYHVSTEQYISKEMHVIVTPYVRNRHLHHCNETAHVGERQNLLMNISEVSETLEADFIQEKESIRSQTAFITESESKVAGPRAR